MNLNYRNFVLLGLKMAMQPQSHTKNKKMHKNIMMFYLFFPFNATQLIQTCFLNKNITSNNI